jgi:hypothetical protein
MLPLLLLLSSAPLLSTAASVKRGELNPVAADYMMQHGDHVERLPLPVTEGLHAHYTFAGFEATKPQRWDDTSGNGRHGWVSKGAVTSDHIAPTPGGNAIGSVVGGVRDGVRFPPNSIPPTFTICSVSRYHKPERRDGAAREGEPPAERPFYAGAAGTPETSRGVPDQGRILTAVEGNWFHGHWEGKAGVAYYDKWRTTRVGKVRPSTDWAILCGQNGGRSLVTLDGDMIGVDRGGAGGKTLTINHQGRGAGNKLGKEELSDWAVAEIVVYDRALNAAELFFLTRYFDQAFAAAPGTAAQPGHNNALYVGGQGVADQIPVRRGLHAHYKAEGWERTTFGVWDDSSGNGRHSEQARDAGALTKGAVAEDANEGLTATITRVTERGRAYIAGTHTDALKFHASSLPPTFTLCTVSRYASRHRYKRRILGAAGEKSWFHGHDHNKAGVAKYGHGHWRTTHRNKVFPNYKWLVLCGQNGGDSGVIMDFGANVGVGSGGEGGKQLAINALPGKESDWNIAEIAVWDRALSAHEMAQVVEHYDKQLYAPEGSSGKGGGGGGGGGSGHGNNKLTFPPLPPASKSDVMPPRPGVDAPGASGVVLQTRLPVVDDLSGHWTYDSWAAPGFWLDISGNEMHGVVSKGTVKVKAREKAGAGAKSEVGFLVGGMIDGVRFPPNSIPPTFTICSVTRYHKGEKRDRREDAGVTSIVFSDAEVDGAGASAESGGLPNEGRILDAAEGDWFHGHSDGRAGVAFYDDGWRTPQKNILKNKRDWLVMCGENGGEGIESVGLLAPDGFEIQVPDAPPGVGSHRLTINHGAHDEEPSDWAVAEIAVWDRALSRGEIRSVMAYFAKNLEDAGHDYGGGLPTKVLPPPPPTTPAPPPQLQPLPTPAPPTPAPPTPQPPLPAYESLEDSPQVNPALDKLVDTGKHRDRSAFHCPGAFRPKHGGAGAGRSPTGPDAVRFDGFHTPEARQGCCVLDKAVGATELISAMYLCRDYQDEDPSKPCYADALANLLRDTRDCCSFDASRPLQRWSEAHPRQAAVCRHVTRAATKALAPGGHLEKRYHRCIGSPGKCYKSMFEGVHLYDDLVDAAKELYATDTTERDITDDAAKFMGLCAMAGAVPLTSGVLTVTEQDDGYEVLTEKDLGGAVDFDDVSHSVTAWVRTTAGGPVVAKVPGEGQPWTTKGKLFAVDPVFGNVWLMVGAEVPVATGPHAHASGIMDADETAGARRSTAGSPKLAGTSGILDGKWHHIAYTFHKRTREYKVYVDGRLEGTARLTPDHDPASYVVKVGYATADFAPQPEFYGDIDRVLYWVRDLDAAEVAQDAIREFAPLCETCLARQGSTLLLNGGRHFDGKSALVLPHAMARQLHFGPSRSYSITAWVRTRSGGTILARSPKFPRGWAQHAKSFYIGDKDGVLHWDVGKARGALAVDTNAADTHSSTDEETEVVALAPGQEDAVIDTGHLRGKHPLLDGRWHHVAMTYGHETGKVTFYVDGWSEGGGKVTPGPDPRHFKTKLAFTNSDFPYWKADSHFKGKLDHVTYWSYELGAQKVEDESFVMPDGESCLPAILHLTANFGEK